MAEDNIDWEEEEKKEEEEEEEKDEERDNVDWEEEEEKDEDEGEGKEEKDEGNEKEGKGKRAAKAIGGAAAKELGGAAAKGGKWVGGKLVGAGKGAGKGIASWARGESSGFGWIKWIIISLILVGILLYFKFGFVAAFAVGGGVLLLAWLIYQSKNSKHKKVFKIALVLIIIIPLVSGIWFLVGTGAGKQYLSKSGILSQDAQAADLLGIKNMWDYFIDCYVTSTHNACAVAKVKGDSGGVFISRLDADLDEYEENSDSISFEGTVIGKSWTSRTRGASAPDVRNLPVKVSVEWKDKMLRDLDGISALQQGKKYTEDKFGWNCEQPYGANSDFICSHKPISFDLVEGTNIVVCGAPWNKVSKGEEGTVYCKARVTAEYPFNTTGFRMIRFSNNPSEVSFAGLSESDVAFSTSAPVILTIGQGRDWQRAVRPPKESLFKIAVGVTNNIPQGFEGVVGDIPYDSINATLGVLTLKMPVNKGIKVTCKGAEKKQNNGMIICTYDFNGKEIQGNDRAKYVVELGFNDAFDSQLAAGFVDYTINGDLTYTTKVSKDITFPIWYTIEDEPKHTGEVEYTA